MHLSSIKISRIEIVFNGTVSSDFAIIRNQLEQIMTKVTEVETRLDAQLAIVAKIGEETRSLIDKVNDLTDALADVDLPEAAAAKLDAMDAQLGIVDGLVADIPEPAPIPDPDPVVDPSDPVVPVDPVA